MDDAKVPLIPAEQTKRCIVMTVLLPENILSLESSEIDSLSKLKKGIVAFANSLKPNDYILFNIGNSSFKFMNDRQSQLKPWKKVLQDNNE
jgi:hypothetical protein